MTVEKRLWKGSIAMHSGIAFSTNDTCDDTLTFGIAFASKHVYDGSL